MSGSIGIGGIGDFTIGGGDPSDSFLGDDPGATRIYDNIMAVLPGVQLSAIKMQLWNTIEEFSLRSTVLRDTVNWIIAAGSDRVDLNPYDENLLVCWVLGQQGLFRWTVLSPGTLVDLTGETAQTRTGTALVALKPASFAVTLPDTLWSTWFEVILDGTLARLYGQPARPYSSIQLASYHLGRYRGGVNRARHTAQRASMPTWRFPYFARGRRR